MTTKLRHLSCEISQMVKTTAKLTRLWYTSRNSLSSFIPPQEKPMAKKIRVGVLGMTHDHIWSNLRDLKASSLGELVAAADPNQELLEKAQSELGCPRVFESYLEMLDEVEMDAVYVYSDNASGAELSMLTREPPRYMLVQ